MSVPQQTTGYEHVDDLLFVQSRSLPHGCQRSKMREKQVSQYPPYTRNVPQQCQGTSSIELSFVYPVRALRTDHRLSFLLFTLFALYEQIRQLFCCSYRIAQIPMVVNTMTILSSVSRIILQYLTAYAIISQQTQSATRSPPRGNTKEVMYSDD